MIFLTNIGQIVLLKTPIDTQEKMKYKRVHKTAAVQFLERIYSKRK